MADDKNKRDFRDRDRVSAEEDYEVEYFAKENDITVEQTRELIRQHRNRRDVLLIAAAQLRTNLGR